MKAAFYFGVNCSEPSGDREGFTTYDAVAIGDYVAFHLGFDGGDVFVYDDGSRLYVLDHSDEWDTYLRWFATEAEYHAWAEPARIGPMQVFDAPEQQYEF